MKNFVIHADKNNKVDLYEVIKLEKFYKKIIEKAIEIIESYNLGKYDYSIPSIGIIELLYTLRGEEK